jgi:hypothetical protein
MSLYNFLSKTNGYSKFGWDLNPGEETTKFIHTVSKVSLSLCSTEYCNDFSRNKANGVQIEPLCCRLFYSSYGIFSWYSVQTISLLPFWKFIQLDWEFFAFINFIEFIANYCDCLHIVCVQWQSALYLVISVFVCTGHSGSQFRITTCLASLCYISN